MADAQRGETARKHAAWLRECARRADALAAEYRANADRIEARAAGPDVSAIACSCDADLVPPHPAHLPGPDQSEAAECPLSQRVDGQLHSWRFDGDDPYVVCVYCDQMQDAHTGRVIRQGRAS